MKLFHRMPAGQRASVPRGQLALVQAIAKGRLLYHGTSARQRFEELNGPAWVSDSEDVAVQFSNWNPDGGPRRVLTYRVYRTITGLARVETPQRMEWLFEEIGGDDGAGGIEMAETLCSSRYNGWIVPDNYGPGADILLCDPMDWLEYVSTKKVY